MAVEHRLAVLDRLGQPAGGDRVPTGARFLLAPRTAAAGYGVPAEPTGDGAYLAVKGVRDLLFAA